MTVTAFYLRVIRRIGLLSRLSQSYIRKRIAGERSRAKLNRWYNRRNSDEKTIFQNLYSKIFREKKMTIKDGTWTVNFRGKELRLPLRNEHSWLDWDNALSIIGHDPDVKMTYDNLLENDPALKVFFDVGANYGTHSLLFLSQGVKTFTFEPNPVLKKEFDLFCDMNNLPGKMESYAIGDKAGMVDFWFPEDATWLGTIVNEAADSLKSHYNLKKITVPLITIDEFTTQKGIQPDLIKIDTEGNEISVLRGATEVIEKAKPLIIFESNRSNSMSGREALWVFFQKRDYQIYNLPFDTGNRQMLTKEAFFISPVFNFIAVPENYLAAN